MTETPETPEVDYGTPRYVTSSTCSLLPIVNPHGGRRIDIYGPHRPVPAGVLTDTQIKHFLEKNLIEHVDAHGNVDRFRAVEALTAIIATDCEPGWGRPRV